MFNFDINHSFNILNPDSSVGKIFYSVPITFSINYIFDIGELFQIPVFTNIGFSLNTYGDRNNNITNLRTLMHSLQSLLDLEFYGTLTINGFWSNSILVDDV